MKIHGKKIEGPNIEIVVIPRSNKEDIVFKAKGILDMKPFYQACPEPKPPLILLPGGKKSIDLDDKGYKEQVQLWHLKRMDWMALESLKATDGLEWETVKYADPETWKNWRTELESSGFSDIEIGRILTATAEANCLSESKIEEARQRFLATEEERSRERASLPEEQKNMPSGERAKDSESNHQVSQVPIGTT